MNEYLVDIIMPVYNHEKFLRQALDSIVNQVTDYKYRVMPSDDCSTDNSRAIILEFAEKYPEKVLPILHKKNLGASVNGYHLLTNATAKYIAICEGDDYWIDKHKLQKQISFLEANPDYALCFGNCELIDNMGKDYASEWQFPIIEKDTLTVEDFILSEKHLIPTATLIFRNVLPKPLPEFYKETISADQFIVIMAAHTGKAKHINEILAAYRIHAGGITKSEEHKIKADIDKYHLLEKLNEFLEYKYNTTFRKILLDMVRSRIMYGSRNLNLTGKLKNVIANTGDYFKYSDKINVKEIVYYTTVLFFPWVLRVKK